MGLHYVQKPFTDEEIFRQLTPLMAAWFKHEFKSFTLPQKYAVMLIHQRENTLITAETGTGKTLSAFTTILSELIDLSEKGKLEDKTYAVYISPLKALNNDIERNLKNPLDAITAAAKKINKDIHIRVGVRTGDTTVSEKAKMVRKPPHILITTPESLAIVLNAPKFKENLRDVQWLIVDEIHSLAENKRGTHLALSIERLQLLAPQMTRIGLSATISPLEDIARFLVGNQDGIERDCKIVNAQFLKKMDLKVISPASNLVDTPQKVLQEKMYGQIHDLIQAHKTTLIFTNTRSATERVVHNLREKYAKLYTSNIEAHHSSLSKEHRLRVETRLKNGELKVVACSTSLELGIDIGYVDLVLLLGSPKSVARCVQRIGRSGHKLHEEIKGRIIALNLDDLVECAVLSKLAIEKKIDKIHIPMNCLDVMAQHIYGMAIDQQWNVDECFKVVTQAFPYHKLDKHDFFEVIKYLAGEYSSLEVRHVYAKIWFDQETRMIGKRGKLARMLYMTNIGTIPDETKVKVKIGEEVIGSIDEGFLSRLHKGDIFVLGGQVYEFQFARGMTVQVRANPHKPPTVPSWSSEMLPLSFDIALEIQRFRKLISEKMDKKQSKKEIVAFMKEYLYCETATAEAIYSYFKEQFDYLEIPHTSNLLIERYHDAEQQYVIVHGMYGRRVNDALCHALAYILGKIHHKDVEVNFNDNGFYLALDGKIQIERALSMLNSKEFVKMVELSVDKTELLKRRFRHVATRGLMILRNYRGKVKNVGRQQIGASILINAVRAISDNFSLLKEAKREVMEDAMDAPNALLVVQGIETNKIKPHIVQVDMPSPFALSLYAAGVADIVKIEQRIDFVKRMHEKIRETIALKQKGGNTKKVSFDWKEEWRQNTKDINFYEVTEDDALKKMAWNISYVPIDMKEEIVSIIDGKTEFSERLMVNLEKYKSEIRAQWPKELADFLFWKMKKQVRDKKE